ncbi:uncharacterized protein JCM15063_003822 [Sporobolomyces koalae]|uniref:uncharacterized protein n=1 Tax=Sporobolomyces koalae TaxID=500713 RepID=UPI003172F32D
MTNLPVRVLVLLDGDQVGPEKNFVSCKAQGGSLWAFQLAEQCRRWVSRTLGRDASIYCLLFADVARWCRSMDLSIDAVTAFSKGLSATPTPCALVHTLAGITMNARNAHLAFFLPSIDYVFLGGYSSENHAHQLGMLFRPGLMFPLPKIVLLQTTRRPVASMAKLAHAQAQFEGLIDLELKAEELMPTIEFDDLREDHPAFSAPLKEPANALADPVTLPLASLPKFPSLSKGANAKNPWLDPIPAQSTVKQANAKGASGSQAKTATSMSLSTIQLSRVPLESATIANYPLWAAAKSGSSQGTAPKHISPSADLNLAATALPPTTASAGNPCNPPGLLNEAILAFMESDYYDDGPPSNPVDPASTSRPLDDQTVPAFTLPVPVPTRSRRIPDRFLPLVQLIQTYNQSTSSSSLEPPLWSTIGSELSKVTELPKGVKFKDLVLEAQQAGWVVTGNRSGESEGGGGGREWVKLSKRAERALTSHESAKD